MYNVVTISRPFCKFNDESFFFRVKPPKATNELSPLREALPQISAVCVKNVLLLAWGLALGFPTILIPNLSGDDPEEEIILGQEAISWIGKQNVLNLREIFVYFKSIYIIDFAW